MATTNALKLKTALQTAKAQYHQGEIDLDALYAAADAYIASLKAYRKRTGKKFRLPSRGYIIRAF